MGIPRPRHATAADAEALASLLPGLARPDDPERAVFVLDGPGGPGGPAAAIALQRAADHIRVEGLAGDARQRRRLLAHADRAARALGVAELRGAGLPDGRRRVKRGPAQRLSDHLEGAGVPLWRDGDAPLSQSLYYRGTWSAGALLVGLGSISLAVFSGSDITLAHVLVPGLLSAAATLFAVFQVVLLAQAARRTTGRRGFTGLAAVAAAAIVAIGALVIERAVPALSEMWTIYTGDEALNDLSVTVSPDGGTLYVVGSYGFGSETLVEQALDRNPGISTVVLAGPGGRAQVGFDLYRMFRDRRLATRVDGDCASACAFAFLGGVERSVSPGGRLGFHRASFPGMSDSDMHASNRDLRRFLLQGARLAPDFVDRVFATPPDDIWVPTPQELLAGRVISRPTP